MVIMFLVIQWIPDEKLGSGALQRPRQNLAINLIRAALQAPGIIPCRICAGGGFDSLDMTSTPKCSCGRSGAAQQMRI
jgi:hypothetical protein